MADGEGALFPWVEANQGFLSVLAIVIALALAYLEYRRANDAEFKIVARPAATALTLQGLVQEALSASIEDGADTARARRIAAAVRRNYELILTGGVPSAALVVVMDGVIKVLSDVADGPEPAVELFKRCKEDLSTLANEMAKLVQR